MTKKSPTKTTLEIMPIENSKKLKSKLYNFKEPSAKFKRWAELFFDKDNPRFYGNKTQCALAAYSTTNYNSASCIGYQNYRKLQFSLSAILELEGLGYGELVKIGASKMLAGSFSDWRELMIMAGYYDPNYKPDVEINIGAIYNIANLSADIAKARRERGLEPFGEVKKSPP
ncbi:MAG: hypothetical protein WC823_02695 [Parcubacteria group bacterium]